MTSVGNLSPSTTCPVHYLCLHTLAMVEIPFVDHAFESFSLSWYQGALLQNCGLSNLLQGMCIVTCTLVWLFFRTAENPVNWQFYFSSQHHPLMESNQLSCDQLSDRSSQGRECADPSLANLDICISRVRLNLLTIPSEAGW